MTMLETALGNVRIVLVEPSGPLNVGAIARVMKNMGLQQLVLVNPQCDPHGAEARQMAIHAADLLETAQIVESLPAALAGCQRAIATTARDRAIPTHLEPPRQCLPWLLGSPSALIFGREDSGLTNEELNYAQRFVRIPSSEIYPSLNLAQSVAICCYELYQFVLAGESNFTKQGTLVESLAITTGDTCSPADNPLLKPDLPTAPLDVVEGYYQQLETVLLKIGYLYPHTAASRMEKFRRLYNRTQLSQGEVAMLRGILSQVEWAISQPGLVNDTLEASSGSTLPPQYDA